MKYYLEIFLQPWINLFHILKNIKWGEIFSCIGLIVLPYIFIIFLVNFTLLIMSFVMWRLPDCGFYIPGMIFGRILILGGICLLTLRDQEI